MKQFPCFHFFLIKNTGTLVVIRDLNDIVTCIYTDLCSYSYVQPICTVKCYVLRHNEKKSHLIIKKTPTWVCGCFALSFLYCSTPRSQDSSQWVCFKLKVKALSLGGWTLVGADYCHYFWTTIKLEVEPLPCHPWFLFSGKTGEHCSDKW